MCPLGPLNHILKGSKLSYLIATSTPKSYESIWKEYLVLLSYLKKKKTKNLMILDILSICIHLGPLLQPLKGSKEAITLFFSNFQFLVCLLKTYAKIWKIESQSIVILVSHPLSDIFRDFGDFRDFLWSDLSTSTPWPLLNFDKIIDIPFLLAQNNIKFARKKGLSLNFAFLSKGPHPPYRLLERKKMQPQKWD